MSRGSAIIAILIAFVGGLAIGHLTGKSTGGAEEVSEVELDEAGRAAAKKAAGDVERMRVPAATGSHPVKGPEDAVITIVEFSDFQCPFCSKALKSIDQVMKKYKGKVRLVWRNNPLPMHDQAMPAAIAAMEVYEQGGDEKFWQYHDILFNNQKSLSNENLVSYAERVGVDGAAVKKAINNKKHVQSIKADQKLGRKIGARGTPHFFVNGRRLRGAKPFSAFKNIIEDELERTDKMVSAGVPKSQVYSQLMKNASAEKGKDKAKKNKGKQRKKKRPDPNAVYKVPVSSNEPSKGPRNALVTVVEFSDFQCPFCQKGKGRVERILKEYKGQVRVVWKDNPLPMHDQAMPAAIAAAEAYEQGGDRKFWKMHDLLFQNQKQLGRSKFIELGKQVGLNIPQLKKALDNEEHKKAIKEDQKLARSLGQTGTPAFFINGRSLRGAQPFRKFKTIIDEELKKAKKMVEQGTSKSELYSKIIADGATSQQFVGGGADKGNKGARRGGGGKEYDIPVPSNAPRKGPKNAEVVIQEFSDFQCPFCSKALPRLDRVKQEYGNKVAIVWRNYPLPMHPDAPLAHQAAMEVYRQGGNEKFWEYHDILFNNQKSLKRNNLEQYAKRLGGIDMAQFRKALDSGRHKSTIQRDKKAVKEAGARIGTPSFFVNGKLIQGAKPFSAFKSKIDAALDN